MYAFPCSGVCHPCYIYTDYPLRVTGKLEWEAEAPGQVGKSSQGKHRDKTIYSHIHTQVILSGRLTLFACGKEDTGVGEETQAGT